LLKKDDLLLLPIEGRVFNRSRAFDRFACVDAHLCLLAVGKAATEDTLATQGLQGQNNSSESSTTAGPQKHKKQLEHHGMPSKAGTPGPMETPIADGMSTTVGILAAAVMPKTQQGSQSRDSSHCPPGTLSTERTTATKG
jgi:hypothetical protein